MNKKKIHVFGNDYYLLGVDKEGKNVYLQAFQWDCDWYWGGGYLNTFTNNKNPEKSRDIDSHTHFDTCFINNKKCVFDNFKDFFVKTVLNDKEIWTLTELMYSFYIARKYSDMLHTGGAHQTSNPNKEIIQNDEEYKRINNVVIPAIANKIYELLTPYTENKEV